MKRKCFQIPIILFFTKKQPNAFEAIGGITELVIAYQTLVQQLQMHSADANAQRTIVAQGIVEIELAVALNQLELVDVSDRCFIKTVVYSKRSNFRLFWKTIGSSWSLVFACWP